MFLEKICRTCLCTGEEMLPLFGGDAKLLETSSRSAADFLNMFTSVPIENNTFLPNNICKVCLNEIQQAYSFKLKCEKSEMILHRLKESNVDLRKLNKIPSLQEFENESNIKLSNIKQEPEEEEIIYDDLITEDNASGSDLGNRSTILHSFKEEVVEFNEKSPNLEFITEEHSSDRPVVFKNEPELHIEDINWANNDPNAEALLNCPACRKECKSLNIFLGHVAIDHMAEKLCKICIERFESNYLNKFSHDKSSVCVENKTTDHNQQSQSQEMNYKNELTDDKLKYQCNVCSKMFPSRGNQIRHMRRVHTDDKPFKCKLCTEKFRLSTSLKVHMETKHSEEAREATMSDYNDILYQPIDVNCRDVPSTSMDDSSQSILTKLCDVSHDSNSLPLILSDQYFVIVEKRTLTQHQKIASGLIAQCQVCSRKISGSAKVTSNFLQHLKVKHPELYQNYKLQKNKGVAQHRRIVKLHSVFDEKVLKFIISTCSPPSIVENSAFLALFEGTNLKVPPERHISNLLDLKHAEMVVRIKSCINEVDNVCCTTDIWKGTRQKTFFGYSCHWIESDFSRKSIALGCRRLKGSHNCNEIDSIIRGINIQFGITDDKLGCTVTDNGSDFVKAFKKLGIQYTDIKQEDAGFDADDDGLIFDCSLLVPQLSKYVQCATHMLNLIATVDFVEAMRKTPEVYDIHQHSMKKCSKIWNKCSRPDTASQLDEIISESLKIPEVTRWNSLYDAIKQLLTYTDKLTDITKALVLENLNKLEIEYLQEYCQFMQPIAECLDLLQQDTNIFYGLLAPTLLTLKAKFAKLNALPATKYLKYVSQCLEYALVDRFRGFFELQPSSYDAVIAAISCPTVKIINCSKLLKIWSKTAPHCAASYLMDIFISAASNYALHIDKHLYDEAKSSELTVHPFFNLEDSDDDVKPTVRNVENEAINKELKNFLDDRDNSTISLNQYPLIKQMFLKYNTTLPSSAPVERLFSFAGIANDHRYQNVSDSHFEKLIIAKCNEFLK